MAGDAGKEAKKAGRRKGGAKARKAAKAAEAAGAAAGLQGLSLADKGKAVGGNDGGEEDGVQARTASGVLVSEARARDIKIQSFSLSFHSKILVEDSTIELNYGRRRVFTDVPVAAPTSSV